MFRKFFALLIILCGCTVPLKKISEKDMLKMDRWNYLQAIRQIPQIKILKDGNFLIFCETLDIVASDQMKKKKLLKNYIRRENSNILVCKISPSLRTLWQKIYGNPYYDLANNILCNEKNSLIISRTLPKPSQNYQHMFYLIDNDGKIMKKKTFSSLKANISLISLTKKNFQVKELSQIKFKNDGLRFLKFLKLYNTKKYIMLDHVKHWSPLYAFYKTVSSFGDSTFVFVGEHTKLIKVRNWQKKKKFYNIVYHASDAGKLIWKKMIASPKIVLLKNHIVSDKSIYLFGNSFRSSLGSELRIVKLDEKGKIVFDKRHNMGSFHCIRSVTKSFDGKFLACGYVSKKGDLPKGFLMKIDKYGEIVWTFYRSKKNIAFDFFDVKKAANKKYLVLGSRIHKSKRVKFKIWAAYFKEQ